MRGATPGLVRLGALLRKEFRQAVRDPRMLAVLIFVPLMQLIVFGFVVNLEVDRLPTVLCDLDRTPHSRDLAARFFADQTFVEIAQVRDVQKAVRMLERGETVAALVFHPGLGERLKRGVPAEAQILIDGADPVRARVAMGGAEQFFGLEALRHGLERLEQTSLSAGRSPQIARVQVEPRILYNPELKSPIYMVPGVVATVLLIVTTIVTAMGIAREREMGTLEQVMVTPLGRTTLVLGKTLPFALIGLLDVTLVLTVGMWLFAVPMRGSLWVIYAASVPYLLTTLGIGLFISTVSRTQQQAILSGFFFIMPAIMLSGFMAPVENMPEWLVPLAHLDPMYYYLQVLRGVMLKGAGFADLGGPFAALTAFGVTLFTASALRFRKRLA
jgi:ABC-2 type transport system permease protein